MVWPLTTERGWHSPNSFSYPIAVCIPEGAGKGPKEAGWLHSEKSGTTLRLFCEYPGRNQKAQNVCHHLASGRRKNDDDGEAAFVRRGGAVGGVGHSAQASTRLDVGLDGA